MSKRWIGLPAEALFEQTLGRDIVFVNDADAAGVAELHFGAARDRRGLVIMTTLGTGIGSFFEPLYSPGFLFILAAVATAFVYRMNRAQVRESLWVAAAGVGLALYALVVWRLHAYLAGVALVAG